MTSVLIEVLQSIVRNLMCSFYTNATQDIVTGQRTAQAVSKWSKQRDP